jgi:hypothetical protein
VKLATEVSIFVRILRVAVVVLALGAIALFGRMAPAIEEILADNVITLGAAEEMLAALAASDTREEEARARFGAALARARANVTEAGEAPLLDEIERRWQDALRGAAVDEEAVIASVVELARLNRASMQAADRDAARLGPAGGWAVALLSLLILAVTHLFETRLETQVVDPLSSLEAVVSAADAGAIHRRCPETGPPEIRRIARGLNRQFDLAARWRSAGPDRRPAGERALLTHLLDRRGGDWAAVDEHNRVLFASDGAWSHLEGALTLPDGARVYAEEIVVPDALRLVRLDGDEGGELETVESSSASSGDVDDDRPSRRDA